MMRCSGNEDKYPRTRIAHPAHQTSFVRQWWLTKLEARSVLLFLRRYRRGPFLDLSTLGSCDVLLFIRDLRGGVNFIVNPAMK